MKEIEPCGYYSGVGTKELKEKRLTDKRDEDWHKDEVEIQVGQ
jgi:hypothetical protein